MWGFLFAQECTPVHADPGVHFIRSAHLVKIIQVGRISCCFIGKL